jgi:C4-dicarboxylate-specific signal transduction histidine kinase
VSAGWKQTAAEALSYDNELRFMRPGGEVRWVHARTAPVLSETGEVIGHVGTTEDITDRKLSDAKLEKTQNQLLETSRMAGMAEVATSVLHNVGNVLNSVNVASMCVADGVRKSKAPMLDRVVAMLREHEADLGAFFTADARARKLPEFLAHLAGHLTGERAATLKELGNLQKNIEHIKDIVAMQQSYVKVSGITETVQIAELIEDTLRMNTESLAHHDVRVVREFAEVPPVTVEKHKVLQILVNLVRNAKHACDAGGRSDKTLTLRVFNGDGTVKIAVSDNGTGIPPENLARIFNHGFTTKKDGHGFGLHSGALAARELGGALSVESAGPGQGATFTLELPAQTPL